MADERIEGVYTIRVEDGPALRAFERMNQQLTESRLTRQALQKQIKQDIAEERNLQAVQKATGTLTAEQSARLKEVQAALKANNATVSEAIIVERGLGGQMREVSNQLSGLEEHQLRFRDKMAQATREALEQSGVLNQLGVRTDVLKNDIQELAAAYQRGEKSEKDFRTENERLQAELVQVSQRSDKLEKEVEELNREFKAGLIDQKAYREGLSRIEEETRRAGVATSGLSQKFDTFAKGQGAEMKSTLSSMAMQYVGVGAAIYGVQRVLGSAADAVLDFDQNLARVSALGGEYTTNITALGDAAAQIGPKFGVGPAKAVESIEALAKAGVSAADILGGALEGALTLSASGSLEAGQAAEYAAAAMAQFGLAGKDVTHIADLLSGAANKAMGEVSDFGNALKFVGPVAAANNIALEETVGTLALFAQNGILGEQAGTSLRGVLSSLTSPSKEATKAMQQLGIVTADGTNLLYDAQGQFKGLANMAEVLRNATGNLTDAERNAALGRIFGNQQLTAANILLKSGAKEVESWTDAVNDSGIASRIANDNLNSMRGSVDKLSAAWGSLAVAIESGDGVISKIVNGSLRGLARVLRQLAGENVALSDSMEALDQQFANGELSREQWESAKMSLKIADARVAAEKELQEVTRASAEKGTEAFYGTTAAVKKYGQELVSYIATAKTVEQSTEGLAHIQDLYNEKVRERGRLLVEQQKSGAAQNGTDSTRVAVLDAGISLLEKEIQKRKNLASIQKETPKPEPPDNKLGETLDKQTESAKATKAEIVNVTGSIADLNAQIQALQTQQAQSTDSAQFAGYQKQIDDLTTKVQYLKGELVSMPDVSEVLFTAPENTIPDAAPDTSAQEAADRLAEIQHQYQLDQIAGLRNWINERELIEAEADTKTVEGRELLNAKLAALDEEQAEYQRQVFEGTLAEASNMFSALQAISDQGFDSKISKLEEEHQSLQERIRNASSEEEKARLEGQAASLESEKKQLEQRKKSAQVFAFAGAMINAYLAASQVLADATMPTVAKIFAMGGVLATGIANAQKILGFAEGGTVPEDRGVVSSTWGRPISRSNGDNMLVTLKRGEVVANDKQQARVLARTGYTIQELGDIPGATRPFARMPRARDYFPIGYASGGTVGYPAVSLSSSQMGQSTMISELRSVRENPVWLSLTELDRAQGRMAATREAGQA